MVHHRGTKKKKNLLTTEDTEITELILVFLSLVLVSFSVVLVSLPAPRVSVVKKDSLFHSRTPSLAWVTSELFTTLGWAPGP